MADHLELSICVDNELYHLLDSYNDNTCLDNHNIQYSEDLKLSTTDTKIVIDDTNKIDSNQTPMIC